MNTRNPPFYLAAVEHGIGFDEVLKGKETYHVHSVFRTAVNLAAGPRFLTILPLRRGCGKDCATVAVPGGFTFTALDVSPGDEVRMSPGSELRLGKKTVVDFCMSRQWRSPLEGIDYPLSVRDDNMTVLKSALASKCADSVFRGVIEINASGSRFGPAGVLDDLRVTLLENDRTGLEEVLAKIIGFGPGLTPSGDDVILGISLVRTVFGRARRGASDMWEAGVRNNLHKTSDLSAFFIKQALEGSAYEAVEHALFCMLTEEPCELKDAINRLLSVGAMSGCDIGLGMYLALNWQRRFAWCSKS